MVKNAFALILVFWSGFAQAITILATTNILADSISNLTGDEIRVEALMPAGIDPHLYRPTQSDIGRLLKADVIVLNGLHLEGRMQEVFANLARTKKVFAIADGISKERLLYRDAHAPDPHIWGDVQLWIQGLDYVAKKISLAFPKHRSGILERFSRYRERLHGLDQFIRRQIEQIPARQRVLITAHDAFGYYGRRYGMSVEALQGISTVSEFGLADISRLKKRILEDRVKALFVESTISPRFIRSIKEALQRENYPLELGGELFSDSLDLADRPAGSYVGMMRHNTLTISNALQ